MRVNTLFVVMATAMMHLTAAQAANTAEQRPAQRKAAPPKFIPNSSAESARERERRLLRECKGRPNAGACSGYAS